MFHLSNRGFPVTKSQLLCNVTHLIKKLKRNNPFTNEQPGRHWYEDFLRHHPEIVLCVAQNLSRSRASVKKENLRQWFQEVKTHLNQVDLTNIDGCRIFNLDESALFSLSKKRTSYG